MTLTFIIEPHIHEHRHIIPMNLSRSLSFDFIIIQLCNIQSNREMRFGRLTNI